jgi:uncharacterized protein YqiB (DUF1249 family)
MKKNVTFKELRFENFKRLLYLIDFKKLKEEGFVKSKSDGYMDLSADFLGEDKNNLITIAMAHNYIENGDIIPDPDMVIHVDFKKHEAFAISYQDRYAFVNCRDDDPKKVKEVNQFFTKWLENLLKQGFKK